MSDIIRIHNLKREKEHIESQMPAIIRHGAVGRLTEAKMRLKAIESELKSLEADSGKTSMETDV